MGTTLYVNVADDETSSPEVQEVVKAIHKLQRKQHGMEIKRGSKAAAKEPEPEPETEETPAKPPKTPPKGRGKKGKKGGKAKKLKADDTRVAYISVLGQFDRKSEVKLMKELGGRILAAHGAEKLSELDAKNYAAFITDCENYQRDDEENPFNRDESEDDDIDSMID